jgi:hypothetical protein
MLQPHGRTHALATGAALAQSARHLTRSYSIHAVRYAADRAVALLHRFLVDDVPGSRVYDVQEDPRFQHRGVDLLWEQPGGEVLGVEVKGDRQGGRRGTYFFELISNVEKDTPGWFLYSSADVLAYVFLDLSELHLLPLPAVREWFLARRSDFPLRKTQTQVGPTFYTTIGALVSTARIVRRGAARPGDGTFPAEHPAVKPSVISLKGR